MKVLITGCTGMLGSDLVKACSSTHEVVGTCSEDFDITSLKETQDYIKHIKPDVIIHSAAFTDVDGCESNIDKAFVINALGTRNIALAANEVNASVAYISTDYVYDGTKDSPYFEYDTVNPLSIYGKSKLEGENFIKSLKGRFYIIRTSWLFGNNGKNFVKTMLELSKTKDTLNIVNDQIGSPTYTPDLAEAINELIMSERYGIYHITNSGYCSWFDFAREIFKFAGIDHMNLEAITTETLGRPAPRPRNSRLEKFYWKLNGFEELRSYKEAVAEYITKL
ncbi:MAG TPA: dTDP-4-dehydrorhamnose reductase [Clostridia bacterium]|nr:dTDP-4-dehydrorhamnose reductase [Clostridia bacterium]